MPGGKFRDQDDEAVDLMEGDDGRNGDDNDDAVDRDGDAGAELLPLQPPWRDERRTARRKLEVREKLSRGGSSFWRSFHVWIMRIGPSGFLLGDMVGWSQPLSPSKMLSSLRRVRKMKRPSRPEAPACDIRRHSSARILRRSMSSGLILSHFLRGAGLGILACSSIISPPRFFFSSPVSRMPLLGPPQSLTPSIHWNSSDAGSELPSSTTSVQLCRILLSKLFKSVF